MHCLARFKALLVRNYGAGAIDLYQVLASATNRGFDDEAIVDLVRDCSERERGVTPLARQKRLLVRAYNGGRLMAPAVYELGERLGFDEVALDDVLERCAAVDLRRP